MENLSLYHIWPLFFPCELNVSINGIYLRAPGPNIVSEEGLSSNVPVPQVQA